jgi:ABC-type amino acid transport substrate-binding protein
MIKHIIAVLVLGACLFAWVPQKPVVPPAPLAPVGIALRLASDDDRHRVSAFYAALADVVERSTHINTVSLFRIVHAASLDEAFRGTDLKGKYIGLDVAVNDMLVKAIGLENVSLTADRRAALVAALREVSNAAR